MKKQERTMEKGKIWISTIYYPYEFLKLYLMVGTKNMTLSDVRQMYVGKMLKAKVLKSGENKRT